MAGEIIYSVFVSSTYEDLREEHMKVAVMHGDLPQPQRTRIIARLAALRDPDVGAFVAGEVACPGM